MKVFKQQGMTLLELSVVLLILIALAGLAIPYMGGTSRKALCDATDITMANVKRVIMDRYYLDTLGYFPKDSKDKAVFTDYSLKYLMTKPSGWSDFDPGTQIGWRQGGYLQSTSLLIEADDLLLKPETDQDKNTFTKTALNHVHQVFQDEDEVILDGWGRPIVLQVVSNADCIDNTKWNASSTEDYCARLVSAGFGSGVGLGNAKLDTVVSGTREGDDRVLYLNSQTTDINPPCD